MEASETHGQDATAVLTFAVYRDFDCNDPAARAPTPLPPMDLGDYDEDMEDGENQESTLPTHPLDKTSTLSADQNQRKDSLVTSQAGQSKVASSSPLSDYPSDMSEEDAVCIQNEWQITTLPVSLYRNSTYLTLSRHLSKRIQQ